MHQLPLKSSPKNERKTPNKSDTTEVLPPLSLKSLAKATILIEEVELEECNDLLI